MIYEIYRRRPKSIPYVTSTFPQLQWYEKVLAFVLTPILMMGAACLVGFMCLLAVFYLVFQALCMFFLVLRR